MRKKNENLTITKHGEKNGGGYKDLSVLQLPYTENLSACSEYSLMGTKTCKNYLSFSFT